MAKIAGDYGFAAINFMDISRPDVHVPFYAGNHDDSFEADYRDNYFIYADTMVATARRTNIPFTWSDPNLAVVDIHQTKKAKELMEMALDHGFTEGLVVPFHILDQFGVAQSALCAYFWTSRAAQFNFMLSEKKHEIHVLTSYFGQYMSDLAKDEWQRKIRFFSDDSIDLRTVTLTDRERDTLAWAARGKTMEETADILGIGRTTVIQHVQNAKAKLGSATITQAAATALYLGLIDY